MPRCKRCGHDSLIINKRICNSCLSEWSDMRTSAYNKLTEVYGPMTYLNHEAFKQQMKRLERIWHKDRDQFLLELGKLT